MMYCTRVCECVLVHGSVRVCGLSSVENPRRLSKGYCTVVRRLFSRDEHSREVVGAAVPERALRTYARRAAAGAPRAAGPRVGYGFHRRISSISSYISALLSRFRLNLLIV